MDAAFPGVSLTQLEAFATDAESLRSLLRDALLNDAPRMEASVFAQLRRMLARWLPQSAPSAEPMLYLQEVLASLLFLSDESLVCSPLSLAESPVIVEADSPHYVSRHVRLYCAELFLYICFSRVFPTQQVVAALYPMLLDLSAAPSAADLNGKDLSQNRIGDGIFFASPRFQRCRRFVSAALNGILLSHGDGAFALVRVFLLEDRVEDSATHDAVGLVARLFTEPLGRAWLCKTETVREVVLAESVSLEESVKLLAPQLMRLAALQADENAFAEPEKPSFVRQQEARWVSRETVEDRLHLTVSAILNAALRLTPRAAGAAAFSRSYRRYRLYNRHFLTPAFGALSLRLPIRPLADGSDGALAALWRLVALARGASLGASPRALLRTLEATGGGVLALAALRGGGRLPAAHAAALRGLLAALARLAAHADVIGELFVRGATARAAGRLAADRVAARIALEGAEEAKGKGGAQRVAGLRELVMDAQTPHWLCRAVLAAAAAECQRRAAAQATTEPMFLAVSGSPGETDDSDASDEGIVLARLVEGMCLALSADALFGGTFATLDSTCNVLAAVATISFFCWRWAALLIPHLFSSSIVCGVLSSQSSSNVRLFQRASSRLRSVVQQLLPAASLIDAADATATAEAAFAAMDSADKSLESFSARSPSAAACDGAAEVAQCVREVAAAMDAGATAALAVALMRLSRVAESAAVSSAVSGDMRTHVQEGMLMLLRVLAVVEDSCAAVAAVSTIVWWALARTDSPDSSFVARFVIALLTLGDSDVAALRQIIPHVEMPPMDAAARIGRLKVRVLDVLLGLCDYDAEGRTLHNVDDYCKKERRCGLFEVLAELCKPPESAVVQIAAIHLIGHYAVATYPRVAVNRICQLCVDVFRHTPHEMAKAACAAMLSQVMAALRATDFLEALGPPDLDRLHSIARAMQSYTPSEETEHAAVVRLHGDSICDSLRRTFLEEVKESVQ